MSISKKYQASKGTCKVTFSYPQVEGVSTVQVLGDFNDWDSNKAPIMKKSKTEFSTVIEVKAGASYEFRYLIDATRWDNDSYADDYVSSPYSGINNSVVILDALANTSNPPKAEKVATKTDANKSEMKAI